MSVFNIMKNLFFFLLFLQIAPPLIENIRKQYTNYLSPRTKVAVLPVSGLLYDSSYHSKYLNEYFKNNEIKAILLKIECAGTASGTGQTIFNELIQLKKQYHKPVIALVENVCASGGYYIASGSDYIIAPGCSLIGSIGVTLPYFFQLRKFIEQFNISYVPLKAGKYKNSTDPFVELTSEDKELLQSLLNDSYQQFAADIASARNLPLSTMNTWADGKLFSGQQALKLGLIDELGSAYTAVKVIKEKAIIEGEIEWVRPPQKTNVMSLFSGGTDNDGDNTMFNGVLQHIYTLCSSLLQNIAVTNRTDIV